MKIIYILAIFTISITANANSLSMIESIELNNGEILNVSKDVQEVQFAQDRMNLVDFVELKEGTLIDSYDIKNVKFKNDLIPESLFKDQYIILAAAGDGSGG